MYWTSAHFENVLKLYWKYIENTLDCIENTLKKIEDLNKNLKSIEKVLKNILKNLLKNSLKNFENLLSMCAKIW